MCRFRDGREKAAAGYPEDPAVTGQIGGDSEGADRAEEANSAQPETHHCHNGKASAPPPVVSEAGACDNRPSNPKSEPFAFADFTWLNGNARTKDTPYATKFFTPEIRSDVSYTYDFRHPQDDTIVGSSEVFRSK
jgi:hypothetical protein